MQTSQVQISRTLFRVWIIVTLLLIFGTTWTLVIYDKYKQVRASHDRLVIDNTNLLGISRMLAADVSYLRTQLGKKK